MDNRIILLHGFNVSDGGENTVGKLRPYLARAGFTNVNMPTYGWFDLVGTWGLNRRFARFLSGLSEPGDVVIAHSNGCAMAYRAAMQPDCDFSHMVFINPALRPTLPNPIPSKIKSLQVWHSPSDKAVAAARLFSLFTLWGNMGAVGYKGPADTRVTNFNKQDDFWESSKAHSDVFTDDLLEFFGPRIVEQVKTTIQNNQ